MIRVFSIPQRTAAGLLAGLLLLSAGGCQLYHNLGTGTHLDAARDHPHDSHGDREREMIIEVTTDANGNVAEIHFQRSSGSDGVDGYVAQSVRESWPRQPSTHSVASLTFSHEKGFSPPKLISSDPVP